MGLFKSLSGMVVVEVTSADMAASLSAINALGIPVFDVQISGDLSARIQLRRRDYRSVKETVIREGGSIRIVRRQGLYWNLKTMMLRPVLSAGMLLLICLVFFLPSRVLFVRVEGNESIPANLILEAAEKSGIGFGATRREVRSEKVKNALLSAVPQLQWAGVNTRGCVAVITVRERAVTQETEELPQVSSIVANRDGIILSVTVTDGNGLCTPGQAVREGDVLISGFTDCGLCITATRAEGEIIARTQRIQTVKTPSEYQIRTDEQGQTVKYSLILGKKRINFYKGSGIYEGSCVKMYTEYCLTLPGGFQLPLTLVKETFITCDTVTETIAEEAIQFRLQEFAERYLRQQMVAGSITDRIEYSKQENGAWCLTGEYACIEMIGRVRTEQIGEIP